MNVRKIRQIGKDILKEPRCFNMAPFFAKIFSRRDAEQINHSPRAIPPCNTVCCFAGEWALRYAGASVGVPISDPPNLYILGEYISDACERDLGLPNQRLFHAEDWPERLRFGSFKAGTKRYAEHFVYKVLEDYIATNGWEGEGS